MPTPWGPWPKGRITEQEMLDFRQFLPPVSCGTASASGLWTGSWALASRTSTVESRWWLIRLKRPPCHHVRGLHSYFQVSVSMHFCSITFTTNFTLTIASLFSMFLLHTNKYTHTLGHENTNTHGGSKSSGCAHVLPLLHNSVQKDACNTYASFKQVTVKSTLCPWLFKKQKVAESIPCTLLQSRRHLAVLACPALCF